MSSREHFSIPKQFRLRGVIDGSERTFPLRQGRNAIGRGPDCQAQILAKGVSQLHAEVVVSPDGLRLEDLRSKNGTFVNGTAVMTTHLKAGDRLWFGSAELLLEEVEDQELELAVNLGSVLPGPPMDLLIGDTPTRRRWLDGQLAARWFTAIEAFVEHAGKPEDLSSSVAQIARIFGARAAAVIEMDDSADGVLLASCGEPDELLVEKLRICFGKEKGKGKGKAPDVPQPTRFATRTFHDGAVLTAALQLESERAPLVLALMGEFPGRTECEAALAALIRLIRRLYLPSRPPSTAPHPRPAGELIFPSHYVPGISAAIQELHAQMEPLGQGDLPVLISGETGAGKEHIANILHLSSDRRRGPFVAINCAAVPAELLEPELFGIGKGVATGVSARPGRFLQAQGGTLFLDEVGDLPEVLQPKLLRALEEGTIQPVGEAPLSIDVRIISATNTDLQALLETGRFRADLYYRLAGVGLKIPPLRGRRDDIPILADHYLRRFSQEVGKPIRGITVRALKGLTEYPWPGNVRELVHEIRRLVYVCPPGEAIETPLIAEHIRDWEPPGEASTHRGDKQERTGRPSEISGEPKPTFETWLGRSQSLDLAALECATLEEALRRTGGNQMQAGRLLGISRMAVRRRIERCRKSTPP